MRKLFTTLFAWTCAIIAAAQPAPVFQQPQFPGGKQALDAYINSHRSYPTQVTNLSISGNVTVNFTVEADGKLTYIKVTEGIAPSFDSLAVKLVREMPSWQPGKKDGTPTRMGQTVTIPFSPVTSNSYTPTATYSNDQTSPSDKVYDIVEQQPRFPGGPTAMMRFISENLKYPQNAIDAHIAGRVTVQFVVEKDGSVSNVEVLTGGDPMLDNEAIRLVKSMPRWTPGKQYGMTVRTKYRVPVLFRLSR